MGVDWNSKDTHEILLSYLVERLTTLKPTYRDRGELPPDQRGAFVLLDGREELVTEVRNQSVYGMPAVVMRAFPQIFYIARIREDADNKILDGAPNPIGPELSAIRVAVTKLFAEDETLFALLGSHGQVVPLKFDTDMQTGSTMEGQIQMDFSFDYLFDPNSL